ncbi:MAG TPA: dienelactone hydrolase family protein [Mycobacterium sp.]|nr:dienelactone hydrolase family protein [Mycobacterium sp.]
MSRISIETPTGPIKADLAVPDGAGPWPGVVVVHDALGMTEDNRTNLQRFADNGFLAIAPGLYSRGGVRCVVQTMLAVQRRKGPAVDDIFAARDLLTARPDCTGAVGIAGFCMGGGFALILASKGFDASAPFYPSAVSRYDSVVEGACPVVASFGRRDVINRGSGPRLEEALTRQGIPHDVKTYDGVGHSFANELPAQGLVRVAGFGYDADVTADAYRRVFAFFGEHLRTS